MFILVVELNLAKCRLPKGSKICFVLKSFESGNARKISFERGNQVLGDPGVAKVRGGGMIFFPSSRGGD